MDKIIYNTNREATHNYFIEQKYDAGLVLNGSEVKSIRDKQITIKGSWIKIENGEAWLIGSHITPYQNKSGFDSTTATRKIKLLLNKKEIKEIEFNSTNKTLIPLEVFQNERGYLKLKFGSASVKKKWDKREILKKKEANKQTSYRTGKK